MPPSSGPERRLLPKFFTLRYNNINECSSNQENLLLAKKFEAVPTRNFFDRSLKILAKKYPKAFLKVALGSIENLVFETIENPEINLPERRLDFVYGLQDEEQEYLLHLEFQLHHKADLPQRMHIYNAFLTASSNKPVISKVIYLERRNYRHLPQEYVVNYQGKRENVFIYEAI